MKTTFNLYRCSSLLWAGLEYEDALHFRIEMAEKAKDYYRTQSRKYDNKWTKENHDERLKLSKLYSDSQDAVDWNRIFIDEIEEERKS